MNINKINDLIVDNMYLCWEEFAKHNIKSCFVYEDKIKLLCDHSEIQFHYKVIQEYVRSLLYAQSSSKIFNLNYRCASDLIEKIKIKENRILDIYEIDPCLKKVFSTPNNGLEFYQRRKIELENYQNNKSIYFDVPILKNHVKRKIIDFFDRYSIIWKSREILDPHVMEFQFSIGNVDFLIGSRTNISSFDEITRGTQNFYFRYNDKDGEIKALLLKDSLPNRFVDVGMFESIEEFLFVVDANIIAIDFYFGAIKKEL